MKLESIKIALLSVALSSVTFLTLDYATAANPSKVSVLLKTVLEKDDPGIHDYQGVKLLAKAIETLAQKLDADTGVTDINYESTVENVQLP